MESQHLDEPIILKGQKMSKPIYKFYAILSYLAFAISTVIILVELSDIGSHTFYINGRSYSQIGMGTYVVIFLFGFIDYSIWSWNRDRNSAIKAYKNTLK